MFWKVCLASKFKDLLWGSHVPGGQMSWISRFRLSILPPWNRQDCSRMAASQPSPLRSDPFGALGWTDDLKATVELELYQSFCRKELPILIKKTLAQFVEQYTQGDQHQKLDHLKGGSMAVVSRDDLVTGEELIKERLEATKLDLDKERLEQLLSSDHPSACLCEDLNDVGLALDKLRGAEKLDKAAEITKEAYDQVTRLTNKHREFLDERTIAKLNRFGDFLILWVDLAKSMLEIKNDLTENSKLTTLISWSKCIGLLSEAVETNPEIFTTGETRNFVLDLAHKVLDATTKRSSKETKKSQYKRSLRNSARFILEQVKSSEPKKGWQLVFGKKSYQELIEESKKKIHLLDSLSPDTQEEIREQEDTLRYLEEHLG